MDLHVEHTFIPHRKINLKWLKDLNIGQDTTQLLEENIHKIFSDIYCTNVFSGQPSNAIEIKANINTWDLIKFTNFCTTKETINKTKRQHTEWEKIFINNVTVVHYPVMSNSL